MASSAQPKGRLLQLQWRLQQQHRQRHPPPPTTATTTTTHLIDLELDYMRHSHYRQTVVADHIWQKTQGQPCDQPILQAIHFSLVTFHYCL